MLQRGFILDLNLCMGTYTTTRVTRNRASVEPNPNKNVTEAGKNTAKICLVLVWLVFSYLVLCLFFFDFSNASVNDLQFISCVYTFVCVQNEDENTKSEWWQECCYETAYGRFKSPNLQNKLHKISAFSDIMLLRGQSVGERHQGLQWNHPAVKEVSACMVSYCQASKKWS